MRSLFSPLYRLIVSLGIAGFVTLSVLAQTPAPATIPAPAPTAANPAPELTWRDVRDWGVEGRAWPDAERARWFDRLPAAAEKTVTKEVWGLSRDSAGMAVRFKTDATTIHVDYQLFRTRLGMTHMPATGVSGVDLYAWDETQHRWRWVNVSKPADQHVKAELITGMAPGYREFLLFLPLMNGVDELKIGVPPSAKFEGLPPRTEKPIVFYGTSITHGACASRPGMTHVAILRRRFDYPMVNLGFSGNGRMDAAVGEFLKEVPALAYVIDCLPNMGAELVTERTIPLVRQLRARQPDTPIVLVEDRRHTNSWILPERNAHHTANHKALRAAYDTLKSEGVKNLHYIEGDHLYGDDNDGATDGSHASDLGFMRQADVFEPVLREILRQAKALPN